MKNFTELSKKKLFNLFKNYSIETLQLTIPEIKRIINNDLISSKIILKYNSNLSLLCLKYTSNVDDSGIVKVITVRIAFPLNVFKKTLRKENIIFNDDLISNLRDLYLKEGNLFEFNNMKFILFNFSLIFKRKVLELVLPL